MWTHKKYKGKYTLSVVKANGDRAFQIVISDKKKITFESWQAAKKAGWVKV